MSFKILSGPAETMVFVIAAVIFSGGVLYYFNKRHAHDRERRTLVYFLKALRVLTFAMVFLFSLSPVVVFEKSERERGKVAVIFDESASMGFLEDGATRHKKAVSEFINSKIIEKIKKANDVSVYGFNSGLRQARNFEDIAGVSPAGNTDISNAVAELIEKRDLSAAIIVSDGQDTSGHDPGRVARFLKIPVFTVGVGASGSVRDLAVVNVNYPKTCYLKEKTDIDVSVSHCNMPNARALLTLRENGAVRSQTPVTITHETQNFRLTFEPENKGLTNFLVELAPDSAEITYDNNKFPFYMNVTPHKMRVFNLAGAPSSDFSFFQRFLAMNKDIAFTSKFIDSPNQGYKFSPGDLSKFDIIAFFDVDFTALDAKTLSAIEDAVVKNNASVFFAGGPGFNIAPGSAIARRFPMEISGGFIYEDVRYRPSVAQAGLNSQITRLSPVNKINEYMWRETPELCGVNIAKASAEPSGRRVEALIEADVNSKTLEKTIKTPILVTCDFAGKKSAALLGGSFWFLKLGQLFSKNSGLYDRFFGNMLLWLYSKEEAAAFRVETDRTNYFSDDMVYVSIYSRNQDFSPMADPVFKITLKNGSEEAKELEVTPSRIENGYYEFAFKSLKPGDYELAVAARDAAGNKQSASAKFITVNSTREFLKPGCNFENLKNISAGSGGKFYEIGGAASLVADLPEKGKVETLKFEFRPFENPWIFVALLLMFSVEWTARRFFGFE